ncbi:MAG: hypothetical protein ABW123_24320 [Cystobacter sp.]
MSDALKAGSVYVAVTASIGEFTKSMAQVVKQVEETAKKVKEAAAFVAGVGGLFAAGIAATVQEAAKANRALGRDTERLQRLMSALVREVGDLFAPAVHKIADALGRVLGAFQRLDPGTKKVLAHFALVGAGAGVVATGIAGAAGLIEGAAKTLGLTLVPALQGVHSALPKISKALKESGAAIASLGKMNVFASLSAGVNGLKGALADLPGQVAGFGKTLTSMLPQLFAMTLPVLALAAAVGALALLAGSVYDAWTDSKTGFKDAVLEMAKSVLDLADKAKVALLSVFNGATNFAMVLASVMFEAVAEKVRAVAAFCEAVARTLGRDELADNLAQVQKLSADGMVNYVTDKIEKAKQKAKAAIAAPVDLLKRAGGEVVDGAKYGLDHAVSGVKAMIKDSGLADFGKNIADAIKGQWAELAGRFGTSVDVPHLDEDPTAVGESDFLERIREMGRKGRTLYQEAFNEHARVIREAVQAAAQSLKEKAVSRTGNVPGLVDSGIQGATVAGPMGAVAAVALDLLTQSEGFSQIIDMVNNTLKMVADALGELLVPLQPLIGSVLRIVVIIANSLKPVLEFVGQLLEPLAPVFQVVGDLLLVLSPLLQMVAGAIELLTLPLRLIVDTGLKLLFEGIKYLGVGVLGVARGISWLWNGVVEGVQWVLRGLANLPFLGALNDVADALNDVKVDRDALKQSQEELLHLTYEQARAKAAEIAATLKNTQAQKEATEALTNVPAAWKVAQRRYEAQDVGKSPFLPLVDLGAAPAAGRTPSADTPAAAAPASVPAVHIDNLNVSGEDTSAALAKLERHLDNLAFRNRGTTGRPGRYALEGV